MSWPCPTIGEVVETGPEVECVWAAGLNIARAASHCSMPGTVAEREALRVSGGGSDYTGASFNQLADGWRNRYGYAADTTFAQGGTWAYITSELGKGHWVAVAGWYATLPAHYKRFQLNDQFYHAIALGYDPNGAQMVDPLGPDGYGGEFISFADLQAFCASDAYKALSWAGGSMAQPTVNIALYGTPGKLSLAPQTQLSAYDPYLPNQIVVILGKWGSTHSFSALADVSVAWPIGDHSIPRGGGWVMLGDGPAAGLIVAKGAPGVTFTPGSPSTGTYDQGYADAKAKALVQVNTI